MRILNFKSGIDANVSARPHRGSKQTHGRVLNIKLEKHRGKASITLNRFQLIIHLHVRFHPRHANSLRVSKWTPVRVVRLRSRPPRSYGEHFAFKGPGPKHAQPDLQPCAQPIGRMQAHVWKSAPSDSAYSRAVCRAIMAAIMRLSNIAMAYVHINCGEWRRLFHHVAPCSLQNAFRSSRGARK